MVVDGIGRIDTGLTSPLRHPDDTLSGLAVAVPGWASPSSAGPTRRPGRGPLSRHPRSTHVGPGRSGITRNGEHPDPAGGHPDEVATLTVWRFDTTDGAGTAADILADLERDGVVVIQDAATVEWEVGVNRRPASSPTRRSPAPSGRLLGTPLRDDLLRAAARRRDRRRDRRHHRPRSPTWASTTASSTRSVTRSPPARRHSSC